MQLVVEPQPGARAPVAIDDPYIRASQVFKLVDPVRVTWGHQQALLAVHQGDQGDFPVREQVPHVRQVIFAALGVQQVAASDLGQPLAQGDQAFQAANRKGEDFR